MLLAMYTELRTSLRPHTAEQTLDGHLDAHPQKLKDLTSLSLLSAEEVLSHIGALKCWNGPAFVFRFDKLRCYFSKLLKQHNMQ
jgi:hypothetical protein